MNLSNLSYPLFVLTLGLATVLVGCSEKSLAPEVKVEGGIDNLPPFERAASAIATGDLDFVKLCVDSDPLYIQAFDLRERTLLHYAAASNQAAIVEYLLQNGADPLATDDEGLLPIDVGQQNSASDKVLDMLREAGLAAAQAQ